MHNTSCEAFEFLMDSTTKKLGQIQVLRCSEMNLGMSDSQSTTCRETKNNGVCPDDLKFRYEKNETIKSKHIILSFTIDNR